MPLRIATSRSFKLPKKYILKLCPEVNASKQEVFEIERASKKAIENLELKLNQSEQMNSSLQDYVSYLRSISDALTIGKGI